MTLEQIGDLFGVSLQLIRYIEARALRKLKHSSRSEELAATAMSEEGL